MGCLGATGWPAYAATAPQRATSGAQLQSQQSAGVCKQNPFPLRRVDFQRADRRNGLADLPLALLGVERRVGCEQTMRGSEIGVPAAGRGRVAVERSIGVEQFEIIRGR